jgi:hypothetical protein
MNRNQNNNHTFEVKGTWEAASQARGAGPIFTHEEEEKLINFNKFSF